MKKIEIWLDDDTVETIDERRGLVPRSAYGRSLIESALGPVHIPSGTGAHVVLTSAPSVIDPQGRDVAAAPSPGFPPSAVPADVPRADDHFADVPKHRHRYEKTGETRPKGNGRGVEHQRVCDDPFCGHEKWEA